MWKQNSEKCSELAKLPYFHFLGPRAWIPNKRQQNDLSAAIHFDFKLWIEPEYKKILHYQQKSVIPVKYYKFKEAESLAFHQFRFLFIWKNQWPFITKDPR